MRVCGPIDVRRAVQTCYASAITEEKEVLGVVGLKLRAIERNNSQHCWPNNFGSCSIRLHVQ